MGSDADELCPEHDIQKLITVSLQNVPLESVMQALLEANGLQMVKKSDYAKDWMRYHELELLTATIMNSPASRPPVSTMGSTA